MVESYILGVEIAAVLVIVWIVFYRLVFLRNPHRVIPSGNVVVSPADGRVIRVVKLSGKSGFIRKGRFGKVPINAKEFLDGTLVSIFMSPLHVHYYRAPLGAVVTSVVHRSGTFFNAGDLTKSLRNEHTQITLKSKVGTILVIPIAGFLARRIHCFVKKKQKVNKGERLGLISMGSQTTVLLPKKITVSVKEGDAVEAGSSIMGKIE
ncbi:MAG: phosphatidylserine decarboxylase [Nanoarchaeota archaeon]|nr:phosphatidylserine decarboxylase [Nanoarchaeota archaeon]